jgi:hypothetical protein
VFKQHRSVFLTKYYSDDQIKSTRWGGHGTLMGRGGEHTGFWWGNMRKRYHLEDSGVVGRIILKCIFDKWDVETWAKLIWLSRGTGGGLL